MKPRILLLLILATLLAAGVWRVVMHRDSKPEGGMSGPVSDEGSSLPDSVDLVPMKGPLRAEASLSAPVGLLVDEQADYMQRLAAAREVSTNLTVPEREALYAFIRQKNATDEDQSGRVLKNAMMDSLCEMDPVPPGLGNLLVDVFYDESNDVVVRDYALQHMVAFQEGLSRSLEQSRGRQDESKRVVETIWAALSETDSSVAGTALLGLSRLSESMKQSDRRRVSTEALRLAQLDGVGELTRISAFQVVAGLDAKEALPILIQAAQGGETLALRISAIGALGRVGDSSAVNLLANLYAGPDVRLRIPAERALRAIEEKKQGSGSALGR
jgi:hypothetical protein